MQLDRAGEAEPEWLLDRDVEEPGLLELVGAENRVVSSDQRLLGQPTSWSRSASRAA